MNKTNGLLTAMLSGSADPGSAMDGACAGRRRPDGFREAARSDQNQLTITQSRPRMRPHNDQRCRAVLSGTRPRLGTTRPLRLPWSCLPGSVRAPVAEAVPTASRIEEHAAGLLETLPRVGQDQPSR